jgi:hypothetical protein
MENALQHENQKRKMHLRIYKSFEEQAEAETAEVALQPPLERIRETVELILRVYGVTREQLNNRKRSNRINIILGTKTKQT